MNTLLRIFFLLTVAAFCLGADPDCNGDKTTAAEEVPVQGIMKLISSQDHGLICIYQDTTTGRRYLVMYYNGTSVTLMAEKEGK